MPETMTAPDPATVGADLFGTEELRVDGHALAEEYDPTPHEYLHDPCGWITEKGGYIWSKQREVSESLVANRYTAVHSCHDTGKSFTAAMLAAWWLDVHPDGEAFVVTTAPTWNQVHAILWREMRKLHNRFKLKGRMTLDARWYMGSGLGQADEELVAYGRKPADYDQAAFQGIHARYVLVIIDEACGVPKLLYDAVDSLVTNSNSRVLAIGNPDDPSAEFEKICRPGSGWAQIHIAYDDTPAFTDEPVPDWLLELLISPEWVEERKVRWGEASPTYVSKVLGEFPDVSDDTLLSPALLKRCQILELKGNEKGCFGGDVARMGTDETCVYRNRGGKIRLVYSKHKQDTDKTTKAFTKLVLDRSGEVPMHVDAVGVGAGVFDNMRAARLPVIEFQAGWAAKDPKRFVNRKAEVYWQFKRDAEEGLVDLPPESEDDDLLAQLGSIKWYIDSKGRIGIESKDDMRKRGLPSPDRADAAIMSNIGTVGQRLASRLKDERLRRSGKRKRKRRRNVTGGIKTKVM